MMTVLPNKHYSGHRRVTKDQLENREGHYYHGIPVGTDLKIHSNPAGQSGLVLMLAGTVGTVCHPVPKFVIKS